ncbi:zinc finger protein 23-like [Monomorium pharaonis]|uniref:zinc finger protein 23-like n=1 Tax=Monomorium pharaonis TaxID=307658 RepID=UPI00063F7B19|nr:zinc finger protein 23-like [Monomorium pharaonis]
MAGITRIEKLSYATQTLPISGFYASTPQLDLNFVLQSCKGFDTESSSGFGNNSDCSSSRTNYFPHSRVRNTYYPKGAYTESKPFSCPKCGRCFTVKGNMTRHYKYECGQEPRFQCPYCEFRSKQTSNVMSHIRTRHAGQKVYVVHLKCEDK